MKRKNVPDSWSSNTEASSAELCPGSRNERAKRRFARLEVSTAGADVFEVGLRWTGATDAVECSSSNLELNPLGHRQPVEGIRSTPAIRLIGRHTACF